MASIEQDRLSGRFRVRFRYGGSQFQRSLKTKNRREAASVLGRVEETLRLIERGNIDVPPDVDTGLFILSDGRRNGKPKARTVLTLGGLFDRYFLELPEGSKEQSTIRGERFHTDRLMKHISQRTPISSISFQTMQNYVQARSKDTWRGKRISPDTIQKELTTFRLIWNWARKRGVLNEPPPLSGIELPKTNEKPPFMTSVEIERIIARGDLSKQQEDELWESLFLTRDETAEFLRFVADSTVGRFVYPLFVFACHTGARRSEILRSEIDDIDFDSKTILIREKKKSRRKAMTYRRVPATDLLLDAMNEWLANHPGGRFTICRAANKPLTTNSAPHYFNRTVKGTKWARVSGYHLFRHSFASNLAAEGVDQRIIDEWMGHQTDEMRKRYRHLFPDQARKAIHSVFGNSGR